MHFANLFHLSERGVFWVTRAKDNLRCHVCRKRLRKPQGPILRDDEVTLKVPASRRQYPGRLRRIEAEVEVNGEWVVMVFLTNNMDWAPSSVCDLYRCRWGIEVFFKQIKQTFKVCDFFGHSKQAIRWQLCAALLLLVLLRYIAFISQWPHSFTRLFALVRGVLWDRFGLFDLADFYGTASVHINRFPLFCIFAFSQYQPLSRSIPQACLQGLGLMGWLWNQLTLYEIQTTLRHKRIRASTREKSSRLIKYMFTTIEIAARLPYRIPPLHCLLMILIPCQFAGHQAPSV